ncbi:ABC transporter permease [Amphibiibacter pelophylacis]|uniref:ABC transporter permease n=1 Tax=Amphibiibacter pelophylacis TaxID=1799477 RepID=A0ACC6NY13_9BURK
MSADALPAAARPLPWWLGGLLIPTVQLALALAVASLVVLMVGENPLQVMTAMVSSALDPSIGLASTLYYTTHLIFTGLAVAVAFHAGLFNIGGEGQAYFAGLGVALACLWLDHVLGAPLMFLVAWLAAMLFGAAWALIPAWLQARRGAHIVVTTIMFNYIAAALMNYLLVGPIKSSTSQGLETRSWEATAMLPRITDTLAGWGWDVGTSLLNYSLLVAILAVAAVWWLLWHTRLGYALRVLGQNPKAADYAGLSAQKLIIIAMLISGALAGLMALNDVYGGQGRLILSYTSGLGFLGIAVALMGRNHPLGVAAAAFVFGVLIQGTGDLQFDFPRINPNLILVIQGLVIFFAAALDSLVRSPIENQFRRWQRARG